MSTTKFKMFIDGYDKGVGEFLDRAAKTFFNRTKVDREAIINTNQGPSKSLIVQKMEQIGTLTSNDQENFETLKITGKILLDAATDILGSDDSIVKRSGVNILNSFFDAARETEDEVLLTTALEIQKRVEEISQP